MVNQIDYRPRPPFKKSGTVISPRTSTDTVTIQGDLTLGAASANTGQIDFKGTTSGTVSLKVADAAGTWTMTLPTTDGDADQVLKTDGSGTLSRGAGGLSWSAVTSNQALVVNTGVLANKGTLLSLSLPATSAVGTVVRVAGMNAGLRTITQGANQYIKIGNQTTTTGAGGSLSSVLAYDCVEMVCIEANLGWVVTSMMGNLTVA